MCILQKLLRVVARLCSRPTRSLSSREGRVPHLLQLPHLWPWGGSPCPLQVPYPPPSLPVPTCDSCIPEASRTSGSFSEEPPLILFIRRITVGASLWGLVEMWEQQASACSFRGPPPTHTHVPQPLGECGSSALRTDVWGTLGCPCGLFSSF